MHFDYIYIAKMVNSHSIKYVYMGVLFGTVKPIWCSYRLYFDARKKCLFESLFFSNSSLQ